MSRRTRATGVGLAVALGVSMFASPAGADADNDDAHMGPSMPEVVVKGLNNPRQLSWTRDGGLLIAEAGKGGTACGAEGPEGPQCLGATGSVSWVEHPWSTTDGSPNRVARGFLSSAGPDGSFAVGSNGVSAGRRGSFSVQETFAPPDILPQGVPGEQAGKLFKVSRNGDTSVIADISKFEIANDPDGHGPDSNPYAVLDTGKRKLVADAAANTVFSVSRKGEVSVFHVFDNVKTAGCVTASGDFPGFDPSPDFPGCNFVPTSLAMDHEGDIYVGGLSSLQPGQAQVVKLDGWSGHVEKVWDGFTSITGVAVDDDENLYISQLFAPQAHPMNPQIQGVVTKISDEGDRTDVDVPFPAGLAVSGRESVFVSAFSVAPENGLTGDVATSGQVWRMRIS